MCSAVQDRPAEVAIELARSIAEKRHRRAVCRDHRCQIAEFWPPGSAEAEFKQRDPMAIKTSSELVQLACCRPSLSL